MDACLFILLEPRVAYGFPLLLEACKSIPGPENLFHVLQIIVEGHSMNIPPDVLKSSMLELFRDFKASIDFPVVPSQTSDAPRAVQIFMAAFIGHLLKLKKREGSDRCLAQLLNEVHKKTHRLRSVPVETPVPNAARLHLFAAILEVLFCTIPLSRCPVGLGRALDPVRIISSIPVQEMLKGVEKLVDNILIAHAPFALDTQPPPYSP